MATLRALVVLLVVVSGAASLPAASASAAEDFYSVPSPLPAAEPGSVIRSEVAPVVAGMDGTVMRVMYHSRSVGGKDIAVTGLIAVPSGTAPDGGWPVVSWAHGTTGLADVCAPSKGFDFEGATVLVNAGYEVVATDYEGLGTPGRHPYIVGESEGRGVLDIVRAARNLPEAEASNRVVIWGHSQGGHAALWAGQIAATWAPELDVLGTVAGAPPSQLQFVYQALKTSFFRYYLIMAAAGINAAYPQAKLDQVLTPTAIAKAGVVDTACGSDVGKPFDGLATDRLIKADPYSIEPWRTLIAAQEPGTVKTDNPILIIHGGNDEQIPLASSALLEDRMCDLHQVVSRRVYANQSHSGVIAVANPEMIRWIDDRFAGRPAPNDCAPTRFLEVAATDLQGQPLGDAATEAALKQLGEPTSQEQKGPVLKQLATAHDAIALQVDRAYRDVLGRPADPKALAHWTGQLEAHRHTIAGVIVTLSRSTEFARTIKEVEEADRPGALVGSWYELLLGRPATAAEVTAAVALPAKAFNRIPDTLIRSNEGRRHRVDQLFRRYLAHPASAAQQAYFAAAYRSLDDTALTVELLKSFDYDDLAQSR